MTHAKEEDDNISRDCSWGVVKEGWVGPRKCWSVGSVGVSKQTKPRSGLKNLPSDFHVCTIVDGGDDFFFAQLIYLQSGVLWPQN